MGTFSSTVEDDKAMSVGVPLIKAFSSTVVLFCVVEAEKPFVLNIALGAGEIVKVSLPSALPISDMPNSIILPLTVILEGVAEDKVALPPLIERLKSPVS